MQLGALAGIRSEPDRRGEGETGQGNGKTGKTARPEEGEGIGLTGQEQGEGGDGGGWRVGWRREGGNGRDGSSKRAGMMQEGDEVMRPIIRREDKASNGERDGRDGGDEEAKKQKRRIINNDGDQSVQGRQGWLAALLAGCLTGEPGYRGTINLRCWYLSHSALLTGE
ncbi:hypothetical protein BO70DRAFT_22016 [Aspergillus heteromorphus CBS 117.55]|uniref:Uncharacterized protein n=1 Tax=Aspergillus heteromorphus CBS 117.55 TaxID=1448321 RepID=A0A317X2R1_9EURO|nr:uncharacterized protein BO70DRAFT_22016 [Aspergillus heteromorphus CBS 117.55]PWY92924.1 hypothetical protein BO70DRAFT_22016 [Aspergillus heteromorphus CBS 117.55]